VLSVQEEKVQPVEEPPTPTRDLADVEKQPVRAGRRAGEGRGQDGGDDKLEGIKKDLASALEDTPKGADRQEGPPR
jgi:hypothetical protein